MSRCAATMVEIASAELTKAVKSILILTISRLRVSQVPGFFNPISLFRHARCQKAVVLSPHDGRSVRPPDTAIRALGPSAPRPSHFKEDVPCAHPLFSSPSESCA